MIWCKDVSLKVSSKTQKSAAKKAQEVNMKQIRHFFNKKDQKINVIFPENSIHQWNKWLFPIYQVCYNLDCSNIHCLHSVWHHRHKLYINSQFGRVSHFTFISSWRNKEWFWFYYKPYTSTFTTFKFGHLKWKLK